jgi:hypothetical protein
MNVAKPLENMKGKELGRPRCRWEDNIRMEYRTPWKVWTGFFRLRIETSGGLL